MDKNDRVELGNIFNEIVLLVARVVEPTTSNQTVINDVWKEVKKFMEVE